MIVGEHVELLVEEYVGDNHREPPPTSGLSRNVPPCYCSPLPHHSPCLLDCYSNVSYLHCVQILATATAHLVDCYSNVLYLHCMQILAIALLFHSLCSAQQQQPLFQITPVHNINMYKAILATTALRLFSCVTALGGLLFTVPLAIPSFLLSSLYHYSYMLHSLDAYEI